MTAPRTVERRSLEASVARRVLHITDCHLKARPRALLLGVDTADTLAAVLDQALAEQRADAVLASGDLAHDPEPATYLRFHELVRGRFGGPVLCLPGNHDLESPLRQVLGDATGLTLGGWEVIGFDSHADHQTEAAFDDAARARLMERIGASRARHVLLACHHHLEDVGCPWLDKDRIPGGRGLLEACAAAATAAGDGGGGVRGLAFGHLHQEVDTRVAGIEVLGTPSTCFQFEPRSPRFALDRSETTGKPGYRWLELHDDGTLTSRVGRVTAYPMNIDTSEVS